jgi:hypothetical protein
MLCVLMSVRWRQQTADSQQIVVHMREGAGGDYDHLDSLRVGLGHGVCHSKLV